METNESILTRSIVGLDERKVLGKMSSLRVDYDTQAVSHYIVMNASTNNAIALPFENAIASGRYVHYGSVLRLFCRREFAGFQRARFRR